MSGKTKIEWASDQWGPVTGCTKVSRGCKHCYAEREWPRLAAPREKPNIYTGRAFTNVRCHPEKLDIPLRWAKPRRIFVNSMSDLFHEDVPDDFIIKVFEVMAKARHHVFLVLTKRAERMRDFLLGTSGAGANAPPIPNVWLGVSCEDQDTYDERIPFLLQTPAAVRWVSAEPLLGPVDLGFHEIAIALEKDGYGNAAILGGIDWVVAGGESGPQARPFDIAWARNVIMQCKAADVACFIKQLGARPGYRGKPPFNGWHDLYANGERLNDRKGGDPSEWPSDLRVREYPT